MAYHLILFLAFNYLLSNLNRSIFSSYIYSISSVHTHAFMSFSCMLSSSCPSCLHVFVSDVRRSLCM
jgi:hypothetical protein